MDAPIEQIAENNSLEYSEFMNPSDVGIDFLNEFSSGFVVRITNPKHFRTTKTRSKLSHICLRDYCMWYSLIGTIDTLNDKSLREKGICLCLRGLGFEEFRSKYTEANVCDPTPSFEDMELGMCEKIPLGHYFPPERSKDTQMKAYAKQISSNKAGYNFYSKLIYNERIDVSGISFRLVISLEGYETKRRYDLLLTRKGRTSTSETHTDGERYGLWACKGGVPVEKVDDWIEGGRGVGTYTYMQAFIDCDQFDLTANRGSIKNSNIEIIDIVREKINEIFKSRKVKEAMQERQEWEDLEKTIASVDSDEFDLKKRYDAVKNRKKIILPNGVEVYEPSKLKNGFSESETFVVFMTVINQYPDLFAFKLLDYNTTKGIDFVVDYQNSPQYIELKGTLTKNINHPFKLIYKFICYDISVSTGEEIEDMNLLTGILTENNSDIFNSANEEYNGRKYRSHIIQFNTANARSIEVISLKEILVDFLGARIE